MTNLDTYIESLDSPSEKPRIAALNLQGLREVATAHGEDSTQFKAASAHFRQFLDVRAYSFQKRLNYILKILLRLLSPLTRAKRMLSRSLF